MARHRKKKPSSKSSTTSINRSETGRFAADPEAIEVPTGESVPAGQWVGVRNGQRIAIGTYYDSAGYLRDSRDHSYVAWHWKPARCTRKGLGPMDLVTDAETGARWCPDCWPVRQAFYLHQQQETSLQRIFGTRDLASIRSELYQKNL